MRPRRPNRLRASIAREAAQLMYDGGVHEYYDAKRIAARRVVGRRATDLPSNLEIREALIVGCNILNTMLELGRPESYSVIAEVLAD